MPNLYLLSCSNLALHFVTLKSNIKRISLFRYVFTLSLGDAP
uniref:Uncharacterized protein n=1 Tax=Setaria italica TaxID=4555 RepID=K4ANJ8_SETIT